MVPRKKLAAYHVHTPGSTRKETAEQALRLRNVPSPKNLELDDDEKHRREEVRSTLHFSSVLLFTLKNT